jgi:hypothetical protein
VCEILKDSFVACSSIGAEDGDVFFLGTLISLALLLHDFHKIILQGTKLCNVGEDTCSGLPTYLRLLVIFPFRTDYIGKQTDTPILGHFTFISSFPKLASFIKATLVCLPTVSSFDV